MRLMRQPAKKSPLSLPKVFSFIGRPVFALLVFLLTSSIPIFRYRFRISRLTLPSRRLLVGCLSISLFGFIFYWYILRDLPPVSQLVSNPPAQTTRILSRDGELLYQIYKDENRTVVPLADIPPHLINATLAAEDKNFYSHSGLDLRGIVRALYNNFHKCRAGFTDCSLEGGSTITQQLVKNVLLTPTKSLTRKLKELVLAQEVERRFSKDQILEMYLNQVNYGGSAYGVEQASQEYFGKSARELSLAESSLLAGLPLSPTTLSPFGLNPYLSKIRQAQVLESMVELGKISREDMSSALSQSLIFNPKGTSIRAPHFVMYIKDLLVQQFGEDQVSRGGLKVTTSLNLKYQNILQQAIDQELVRLARLNVSNAAGLILAPKTGEVLAMVGSHNFFDTLHDGQVNVTLKRRQPGSSIKPITYALALSRGMSPASLIDDSPVCYVLKGQPDYCPTNYDGRFHGSVTLRTALASSYNIPATKLLNAYGVSSLVSLAQTLGISTWDDPSRFGLSLTLGGGEITMLDLAQVYSVFASGGYKTPLSPILDIQDGSGHTLYHQESVDPIEVLPPSVAYQINSILSDPSARAPAFGYNSILNLPGKNVAVKTGTTNNLRDNWTFGYTQDLLVSTWVGNNDNSPMSSVASGITGASPIWANTMVKLLAERPATPFTPPSSMIRAQSNCASPPAYEYFIPGSLPSLNCSSPETGLILDVSDSTAR